MSKLIYSDFFGPYDSFGLSKQNIPTNLDGASDFLDIDDLLERIGECGDYKMLPLAISFMRDLTPFDINSFFDLFTSIEKNIFEAKNVDYSGIILAYHENRKLISNDFIEFIIRYYSESNNFVKKYYDDLQDSQKEFIRVRFTTVQILLIQMGRRLSHASYANYIADDDNT